MSQERMNMLSLLSLEHEFDGESVIRDFALEKARRVNMIVGLTFSLIIEPVFDLCFWQSHKLWTFV